MEYLSLKGTGGNLLIQKFDWQFIFSSEIPRCQGNIHISYNTKLTCEKIIDRPFDCLA